MIGIPGDMARMASLSKRIKASVILDFEDMKTVSFEKIAEITE